MGLAQRCCAYGDILETHLMDLFHDHIHDEVAVSEVMVEGDCHSVMSFAFYESLPYIGYQLGFLVVHNRTDRRSYLGDRLVIQIEVALERFLTCKLEYLVRDVSSYCIDHITNPPYTHRKPWQALSFSWRRRRTRCLSSFRLR